MVPPHVADWLSLALRWTHLIAGIAWIGSSFYFIWLDSHLEPPPPDHPNVEGQLWMVHSGGFYQVLRRRIGPGQMPRTLHWFKWEAAFTWMTGIALLTLLYYLSGGIYLVDPAVSGIGVGAATGIAAGLLVLAWLVYDALWRSPLAAGGGAAATAVSFVLLAVVTYGLCHLLSGRAAYIHVGAMLGTIMVVNVWARILPAQQRMIDATARGEAPDLAESARAKRRSVHNSYVTFPVLFIMLSNHYPATYGNPNNWLVLLLLFVVGAGVRHLMIGKGRAKRWTALPVAAALATVILMTAPSRDAAAGDGGPAFGAVRAVVNQRCLPCHSAYPTDSVFRVAPVGVTFDSPEAIRRLAERIRVRAVETKTMPFGNKTGMTDAERGLLGRWVSAGAHLN